MTRFLINMLTVLIDSAVMPTGKNLIPTIYISIGITVINMVLRVFSIPVALNFFGCLLAIVVLLVVLVIERSEYSAVSELYRDAELRIKDLAVRQQEIRANWKNSRTNERGEKCRCNAYGGAGDGPDGKDED